MKTTGLKIDMVSEDFACWARLGDAEIVRLMPDPLSWDRAPVVERGSGCIAGRHNHMEDFPDMNICPSGSSETNVGIETCRGS